jgi:hypothetical protein
LLPFLQIKSTEQGRKRKKEQRKQKKKDKKKIREAGKPERAREHRRKNVQFTSTSQIQRLCFVRHLPIAKEARVSCSFGLWFCFLQIGAVGEK